jgi:hypothetical protein
VFSLVLGAVLTVMVISYVAVPARIIGIKSRKLPPKEAIGRAAAGGTLSAVAITPGFLLGRAGLILLGLQSFAFWDSSCCRSVRPCTRRGCRR